MLNANEFFEIVGELYYNRYHRLRPGKSVPSVCGYDSSSEENTMQFKEWVEGPLAFNDAIERIGKLQFVLASDYEVLAASVDRLTSDKARLAAELAAEQESNTFLNNLHKVDQDRLRALEAALLKAQTVTCYQNCETHKGLPFTVTVGYAGTLKTVCPICSPPEMQREVAK